MLRTLELSNVVWNNEDRIWDLYLSKISWAIRSAFNTTSKFLPRQLTFNDNIILQTQCSANWEFIKTNNHNIAINNNIKEKNNRISWDYKVRDKVLLDYKYSKLDKPYLGPFDILNINTNGTIKIQKGRTEMTVNIRQLYPFWRRS